MYTDNSAYHWGSVLPISNMSISNYNLIYYELDSANYQSYKKRASSVIHFFHGLNPHNIVYISNMYSFGGDNCANEIYHAWFSDKTEWDNAKNSNGPPPGFLVGGPNREFKWDDCCPDKCGNEYNNSQCKALDISSAINQPPMKCYLDFNTGWPLNSWAVSESAIYYQAAYLRMIVPFVKR